MQVNARELHLGTQNWRHSSIEMNTIRQWARIGAFADPKRWLMALALIGIAVRIGLWAGYGSASYGDTPSYMRLAATISESGLDGYDGTRVPGYPIFLAVLDQDPRLIWLTQMAMTKNGITRYKGLRLNPNHPMNPRPHTALKRAHNMGCWVPRKLRKVINKKKSMITILPAIMYRILF